MTEPKWLRLETLEILHEEVLAEHGGLVGVRDPGLLESALAPPENAYTYGEANLFTLAALYTSGIIRNHPYLDGNKRAGFMAGAVFLQISGGLLTAYAAWLKANTETT